MKFSRILLFLGLLPSAVFAANIDVSVNMPSGTYDHPINIELTTTDKNAKIFYSFKPEGTPADAFLYTSPVTLKQSSPFIYFAIVNSAIESKINQTNYIINYPSDIHFSKKTFISSSASLGIPVSLFNNGTEPIDISYWYVQSEIENKVISEGTILSPGANYTLSIGYKGAGAIVLRSPNDDEKDLMVPEDSQEVSIKAPAPIKKVTPRKMYSLSDELHQKNIKEEVPPLVPKDTKELNSISGSSLPSSSLPSSDSGKIIIASAQKLQPELSLNTQLKASTQESGQKFDFSYFGIVLLVSLFVGLGQWFYRMRKKS